MASQGQSASELISKRIAELGDWRGQTLGRMRKLIKEADPDVVEEWKWMGTPVWSHDGIISTGESYKKVVKLTFAKGASMKDPARLFNSSLDGNVRRAARGRYSWQRRCRRAQGQRARRLVFRPRIAPNRAALVYLIVAAPALHATSSCDPVPPEQPIAPTIFPPSMSGIPPREAIMPSRVSE